MMGIYMGIIPIVGLYHQYMGIYKPQVGEWEYNIYMGMGQNPGT